MTISTIPLTKAFGAEIKGVDLSSDLSAAEFEALRDTWLKHKVIILRDQSLDEDDMVRFAGRIGELERHVRSDAASKINPNVLLVSNKVENGKPAGVLGDAEAPWHIDQIYMQRPTFGTMLHGIAIPPDGGNTYVCDLATAYDRLPAPLLKKIEGRRAIQSAAYFNRRNNGGMTDEQLKQVPDVSHPMVRTHPLLKRKSLFFSPGHTMLIDGYAPAESEHIVDELCKHATGFDDLVYEHRWRPGDVLMWDNTSTMHRRDPFDGAHLRLLKRVSFMYPAELRVPF